MPDIIPTCGKRIRHVENTVRDLPVALTVGLGAGVALCFVILLVTSVAIFARYTYHDDRKKMPPHDSNKEDNISDPSAPYLPNDDEPKHYSANTPFKPMPRIKPPPENNHSITYL
ncbi:hypothetical protein HOLleu_31455 [Holothuria leucospilota]|uniref:Uncharacterized protein n=1 Tax=Holothuria leucospilota TaxID=206669 RepID=A0A9Q0YT71_HOLLE|nr:hypothetical protein HOLleu_31455 [Holothuria leucospilota]